MKSFGWIVMFSLVFFLVATSTSWAQGRGTPPETRNCEEIDPNEYNGRLDCKTENVNSALYGFVDRVIALDRFRASIDGPRLLTEDHKDNLLAVRERAQNAKNRTKDAEGFKGAVKKQKSQDEDCFIKELNGDGDGICEKGEDCEEVIGDGIPDDDGICETKGKNKEVCVEVCQQPLLDDDENYDAGAALDMEEELTELEAALIDADVKIDMLMRAEIEAWNQQSSYDTILSTECGSFDATLPWVSFGVMQALQVLKNIAAGAFESCDVVCNQDSFGWNCSAVCLALAIVSGVADIAHDATDLGFKVADEVDAAAQMEKLAQCTQNNKKELSNVKNDTTDLKGEFNEPSGKIVVLQGDVTTIKDDIADLKVKAGDTNDALTAIRAELDLLKSLLQTPPGRREGFPQK